MKKLVLAGCMCLLVVLVSCDEGAIDDNSQVKKAAVDVPVGVGGLTAEQRNIGNRLLADNKPGSIKHLYIFSAYSGQVLIYSTVKEKVTSSGKRLAPTTTTGSGKYAYSYFNVSVRGHNIKTPEVMQDDGSYGSSIPYLYWWDAQGIYHQHYVAGGQIIHISDQPLDVPSIIINMELTKGGE